MSKRKKTNKKNHMNPVKLHSTREARFELDLEAVIQEVTVQVSDIISTHEIIAGVGLHSLVFEIENTSKWRSICFNDEILSGTTNLIAACPCCCESITEKEDVRQSYKAYIRLQLYSSVLQQLELNRSMMFFSHSDAEEYVVGSEEDQRIMEHVKEISREVWEKADEARQQYEQLISKISHPIAS